MANSGPKREEGIASKEDAYDEELEFFGHFEGDSKSPLLTPSLVSRPPSATPIVSPKLPSSVGKQPLSQSMDTYAFVRSENLAIPTRSHVVDGSISTSVPDKSAMTSMYDLLREQDEEKARAMEFAVGSVPGVHDYRRKGYEVDSSTKPKSHSAKK